MYLGIHSSISEVKSSSGRVRDRCTCCSSGGTDPHAMKDAWPQKSRLLRQTFLLWECCGNTLAGSSTSVCRVLWKTGRSTASISEQIFKADQSMPISFLFDACCPSHAHPRHSHAQLSQGKLLVYEGPGSFFQTYPPSLNTWCVN